MILCRCLERNKWPKGRKGREYVAYLKTIGYPESSTICGLCDNPGVIWIEESEEAAYIDGKRIFDGPNKFTRVKADNSGIHKRNI
jgi:hypothetical protein